MTLDPVHFDGIARLARNVSHDVDESEHREVAATVWAELLDPLWDDGRVVLEPLGDLRRRSTEIDDVALRGGEFETTHGLDSGTINPTTFKNGLVLDVAQAAMAACPSDLELHRERTIVMTAHTGDPASDLDTDWQNEDEGYCRQRFIQVPRVNRYEEAVVHALALYLAESKHALGNADEVEDLLYLDGPLYPTGMLNWLDRDPELRQLLVDEDLPRDVVRNYVRLVERFVGRDVPLVGFVKNPGAKAITRTLRKKTTAPWVDDAALFRQILERHEEVGGELQRRTDQLTFTSWFRSRGGTDRVFSQDGEDLDVDRELDPEAYEVTFCVIYDPREDVVFRLEAPYAFTRDEDRREALVRQALTEIAAERGPPLAVRKADDLARISRDEKESLRTTLERQFDSERHRSYDDVRWDDVDRDE
ncbi:nuclease [Halobacteriales archaeon QS_1_68_20]|nr:MAG: nuclease [Halobacteriales archaeon QS_1_68_20]